ncbi:MAG: hypothetical protein HZA18_03260 [Nitrospirae bacterium]|nr:hypothetical protein [Nitrospirota bacterium]
MMDKNSSCSRIIEDKSFYEAQKNRAFVLKRIERNVKKVLPPFTNEMFWEAMISCLITTQQRSGPNSYVTKFICTKPFPLNYSKCKASGNLHNTVEEAITTFGGLRRGKTIGEEVEFNFKWLESGGWKKVYEILEDTNKHETIETERKSAEIIMYDGPRNIHTKLLDSRCRGNDKFDPPDFTKTLIS